MTKLLKDLRSVLNVTVVIAGLGYFVDLFDITLFAVVRQASLKDLGITSADDVLSNGDQRSLSVAIGTWNWRAEGDMP